VLGRRLQSEDQKERSGIPKRVGTLSQCKCCRGEAGRGGKGETYAWSNFFLAKRKRRLKDKKKINTPRRSKRGGD